MVDPELEKLGRYRKSASGKSGRNAARDFHRYIHRDGKCFPVQISHVLLPIRMKKPNKAGRRINVEEHVNFPIITLSDWMASIMKTAPQFFLAGHCLSQVHKYGPMFQRFWDGYQQDCPGHPIFSKPRSERKCCIPICLHGDEGRGLSKTPLMVLSYQVVIPHNGENSLNIKKQFGWIVNCFSTSSSFLSKWTGIASKFEPRHSFTTRLLFSLLPATWYAKGDGSIDGLAKAIADDLTKLFHDGVLVGQGEPQLNPLSVIAFGFWVL